MLLRVLPNLISFVVFVNCIILCCLQVLVLCPARNSELPSYWHRNPSVIVLSVPGLWICGVCRSQGEVLKRGCTLCVHAYVYLYTCKPELFWCLTMSISNVHRPVEGWPQNTPCAVWARDIPHAVVSGTACIRTRVYECVCWCIPRVPGTTLHIHSKLYIHFKNSLRASSIKVKEVWGSVLLM